MGRSSQNVVTFADEQPLNIGDSLDGRRFMHGQDTYMGANDKYNDPTHDSLTSSVHAALGGIGLSSMQAPDVSQQRQQQQPVSMAHNGFAAAKSNAYPLNGGQSGSSSRRHSISVASGPNARRGFQMSGYGFSEALVSPEISAVFAHANQPYENRIGTRTGGIPDADLLASDFAGRLSLGEARASLDRSASNSQFIERRPTDGVSQDVQRGNPASRLNRPTHTSHQMHSEFDSASGRRDANSRQASERDWAHYQHSQFDPTHRHHMGYPTQPGQPQYSDPRDPYRTFPSAGGLPQHGGVMMGDGLQPGQARASVPFHQYQPGGRVSQQVASHGRLPQEFEHSRAQQGQNPFLQQQQQHHPHPQPTLLGNASFGQPGQVPPSFVGSIGSVPHSLNPQAINEMGKGASLQMINPAAKLYIVEFKAGRTDLFYTNDQSLSIRLGDLVIVEADRGQDLGKIKEDKITVEDVKAFNAARKQESEINENMSARVKGALSGIFNGDVNGPQETHASNGGAHALSSAPAVKPPAQKEILPKRIFGKAGPADQQLLTAKLQDEAQALTLCQQRVKQKRLPMEVLDAEYQW